MNNAIDLNFHLKAFQEQVRAGFYNKINYDTWRELNQRVAAPISFSMTGCYQIGPMAQKGYNFHYQDKSFGQYLWENTSFCTDKINEFMNHSNFLSIENNSITRNYEEENNTMNFNFDFGPVKSDVIKMSIYGLAVKNASGTFVSYSDGSLIDVDILNFDGSKFLYKMPVAIKEVKVGDIVIHARKPMFVTEVLTKSLKVVDPIDGEAKEVLLTKSPFKFDFVTKVVNILGSTFDVTANSDNPFGNMWMLFALASDGNKQSDMLLPLMMMNQSGVATNPMMMYALLAGGHGSNDNALLAMAMMSAAGQTNPFGVSAPAAVEASN